MTDQSTAEATAEATSDTSTVTKRAATFTGNRFGNCGYTFDVLAGTYNLSVVAGGSTSPLLNLSGTQLSADTYYFVAAVGSPAAPQAFVFSVPESNVSTLLNTQQNNQVNNQPSNNQGSQATAQPTQPLVASTPEVTPTVTPGG